MCVMIILPNICLLRTQSAAPRMMHHMIRIIIIVLFLSKFEMKPRNVFFNDAVDDPPSYFFVA